jgi:hypothetical protein
VLYERRDVEGVVIYQLTLAGGKSNIGQDERDDHISNASVDSSLRV